MSSSDRRAAIFGLCALAGCGFAPAYGPGGAASGLRGEIAVDAPVDRAGYIMVRRLEERLGRPRSPRYRLAAAIRLEEEGLGVTRDQITTRFEVIAEIDYRLTEITTGASVAEGTVGSFTGYSATSTTVATRTAQDAARRRLMRLLADQIVARLLTTADQWRR